jgi:glutamate formiminotransferase
MTALVECVPNYSEGRNLDAIREICGSARDAGGRVISCEADASHNRTDLTFVGDPEMVSRAAFEVIRACSERIDMRSHQGSHPRMGACDVTPFVPVSGIDLAECADLARRLGKRVGEELDLPVYLYGAAGKPGRENLSVVRKGQYEALPEKLADPAWAPDFGPAEMRPKFGAAAIGARPFLVAFNVYLDNADVEAANAIAKCIRTSGRIENGVRISGTLPAVKGIGLLIEKHNLAQVSMNLDDFTLTNMHQAYREIERLASEYGRKILGSEIAGILPRAALVDSGRFFGGESLSEDAAVTLAITELRMNEIEPFDADDKILENLLEAQDLVDHCQTVGKE